MANDIFRPDPSTDPEQIGEPVGAPQPDAGQGFVQPSVSILYDIGSVTAGADQSGQTAPAQQKLPPDFGYDDEHPLLKLPFSLTVQGQRYTGESLSLMQIRAEADEGSPLGVGSRHIAVLHIAFENFSVTLHPEVTVLEEAGDGRSLFQFANPTGDHLPQLRYILNSFIAGDFVTIDGMVSYTGPVEPKKPKGEAGKQSVLDRVRSISVAAVSGLLILMAAFVVLKRYTTAYEMHPVFVERAGQKMRATAAGQISYLNPSAAKNEVLYAINANTGDVLNFKMPCDCEAVVSQGVSEGATVLQTDLILTIFVNTSEVRAQTLMSIEGLNRAMNGDMVTMDLNDGRSIPVTVIPSEATTAASMRGDLFVPVELVAEEGALTMEDVGKSARLRLSKSLFGL
ncbi:hypothetical protein [Tropicibacter oceani]|uniref:Uncharacterized protein n=1 Tax=Tropicibacter oceani TaxID=3058420 RepID=A0ABY8QI47_9RHOB|nr:hypothetical protein [Tropicibacter oceani]WGW04290.1 hypothetical protein QF118_01755 [Tropicibacter oceani]